MAMSLEKFLISRPFDWREVDTSRTQLCAEISAYRL